jgi:hypothetical protein
MLSSKGHSRSASALVASLISILSVSPAGAQVEVHSISEVFGPNVAPGGPAIITPRQAGRPRTTPVQRLRYWNEIAIDAGAVDHTPRTGETKVPGEQLGPARTSRALAMVQVAVFEAVNAIGGTYRSYTGLPPAPPETSLDVAIAQAAHDVLRKLYAQQADIFSRLLKDELADIVASPVARANGIRLGQDAADSIFALRADDGANHPEPHIGDPGFELREGIGYWSPDPFNFTTLALGGRWAQVRPFVITSASQFRTAPPPALASADYAAAYKEVKSVGGAGGTGTPTDRTPEQTEIGVFWAYDGTPALGTPPRLYNQIAVQIAEERNTNVFALARLLALLNVAMADAAIAAWDTKFEYQFWRPVTAIQAGNLDPNPDTEGDRTFMPLGAPLSNLIGKNFTPPFPAYTSGHATFGGAVFQTLRRFYGTDLISFRFQSDEFNGVTKDNEGRVRPRLTRKFDTLGQAEEENGQSRIYLGIHWSFDKTKGIRQGERIANFVFRNAFVRLRTTAADPGDPETNGTVDTGEGE